MIMGVLRLVGLLAIVVGVALCANLRGAATTIRTRRATWGHVLGGPVWFWRAWGGFVAICGLMLVIRPSV